MWSKIKQFFILPVFEDEDKTRTANLLNFTMLTLILSATLRTLLSIWAAREYLSALLIANCVLVGVSVMVYILMRKGFVRFACLLYTFYQWGTIAFITYLYGGVSMTGYSFFIFVILAAGLLLGGKWAVIYAIISFSYGGMLLYLEKLGFITPSLEGSMEIFITITPSFLTTTVIVYLYHRDITRVLTQVRDNSTQLAHTNTQLISEITARERIEEQLLQVQKMEAIGRLSGGIAHDFNNLLVPILGYSNLALMNLPQDSKLYSHLQEVKTAAERASNLTRQILAFSRQQQLAIEVLDLNTVITEFRKMIQHLIREDIELKIILAPVLYCIMADKMQIEQVLMNLVVNARDAMPRGGRLNIETENVFLDEVYTKQCVDVQAPGWYVMVAVSDTGHGMDTETKKRVFEPFFTTKKHDQGTGLGLATVFGIVRQHQGNIWVYSEPGKGTTFKIYLPRSEQSSPAANITTPEPVSICGTETVLVVEDEEAVRKLVCETLQAHGYNVIEAKNPAHVLQLAAVSVNSIHLLLTDVVMPGMNGRELYKKVAALQPGIKVLYMSGYTDDIVVHHGVLDAGANLLQKPFMADILTMRVRQILG